VGLIKMLNGDENVQIPEIESTAPEFPGPSWRVSDIGCFRDVVKHVLNFVRNL